MALSKQIFKAPAIGVNEAIIEKVILQNDFAGLSSLEKVQHVKNICMSLGLNPLTKPIQLIKFQGKEIPYVTKDATEQLRKLNGVSIVGLDIKLQDGLYMVIANATAHGRTDSSTGVISIKGLVGDALANAMMKCETKAKRRVTLSICGLGFMDESELDTLSGHQKISVNESQQVKVTVKKDNEAPQLQLEEDNRDDILMQFNSYIHDIDNCKSIDELKDIYCKVLLLDLKNLPELKKQLIEIKDRKKDSLLNKEKVEELNDLLGDE